MKNLLVIHSSPKRSQSITRDLTTEFIEKWRNTNPQSAIINRDVGVNPPPHLTEETIGAFYTPAEQRSEAQKKALTVSDELIAELRAADEIVIASPMHNFSITSGLKTWIDQIARVGETFQYTEQGPQGLLKDRPVYVITASGGDYRPHTPIAFLNHQDTYLKVALNFVGLQDLRLIQAAGVAAGEAPVNEARTALTEAISA
ncbi:FMN-dependent NADH-azoreductase [Oceanospirillum linum]|uniref:FMN dependent NADH:quinone oxidoreductase n=1 Tax=Oceanospirillum linum TaxID=966 RepID=A0A1T1H814_OCELI|nr:NAD(P)H-dependent oxidoreductase [Oceanospirillum linum]OOV86014.1 FMN-dependent NADH-azoreductase [Oceanospirillum linum]SEG43832.1 FMN-dependent NADH-azoreductase [Oleiphilus messinensis]SMP34221.1 FMN-dependent NADH-azoreductase [Oceanospirillum linum]